MSGTSHNTRSAIFSQSGCFMVWDLPHSDSLTAVRHNKIILFGGIWICLFLPVNSVCPTTLIVWRTSRLCWLGRSMASWSTTSTETSKRTSRARARLRATSSTCARRRRRRPAWAAGRTSPSTTCCWRLGWSDYANHFEHVCTNMSLRINHIGPHPVSPHELRAACSGFPAATCIPDVHVFRGGSVFVTIFIIECLMLIISNVKRGIVLKLLGFF